MTDDPARSFDRRSVLKMTGAALTGTVGFTGLAAADTPPKPESVSVEARGDTWVDLQWDEDAGTDHVISVHHAGCSYYGCGMGDQIFEFRSEGDYHDKDVRGLRPGKLYGIVVQNVDDDGHRSDGEEVFVATEGWQDDQVLHTDRDDHQASWSRGDNGLGGYWSASGFQNGQGDVTDSGLELQYDGSSGVFETFVGEDGNAFDVVQKWGAKSIKMRVSADQVDEEEDVKLTWNGGTESEMLDYYTVDSASIQSDRPVTVAVPLVWGTNFGTVWDVEKPETWKLAFNTNGTDPGTLTIHDVWVSNYD